MFRGTDFVNFTKISFELVERFFNQLYIGQGIEHKNYYGMTSQRPLNHEPQIYELLLMVMRSSVAGQGRLVRSGLLQSYYAENVFS